MMLTLAPHLALTAGVAGGFLLLLLLGPSLASPAPAPALERPPRRYPPDVEIEGIGCSPAPPQSTRAVANPTVIDAGDADETVVMDTADLGPWPDPPALPPAISGLPAWPAPTTGEQAALDGWLLAPPTEEAA